MPSTKGLEVLVRKDSLTHEEWISLVESRRELIKPHLDSFTLPELGKLKCLGRSFYHEIELDRPIVTGDEGLSLKTQGVFATQPWQFVRRIANSGFQPGPGGVNCPDGTLLIWGLARSGAWILATLNFVGEAGYKDRGAERATSIKIVEASLREIIFGTKEDPQMMWMTLGGVIQEFANRRHQLYLQARDLAQIVLAEESALKLIPK